MKRSGVHRSPAIVVAGLAVALLAAGCSNDDGSGTEGPLLEEGSNVIPSGTGQGSRPARLADSIPTIGDSAAPAPMGGQSGVAADSMP